jgi:hypothetical protein
MWYLLKVVLSGLFLIRENGLINPGASHFIVGLFAEYSFVLTYSMAVLPAS